MSLWFWLVLYFRPWDDLAQAGYDTRTALVFSGGFVEAGAVKDNLVQDGVLEDTGLGVS